MDDNKIKELVAKYEEASKMGLFKDIDGETRVEHLKDLYNISENDFENFLKMLHDYAKELGETLKRQSPNERGVVLLDVNFLELQELPFSQVSKMHDYLVQLSKLGDELRNAINTIKRRPYLEMSDEEFNKLYDEELANCDKLYDELKKQDPNVKRDTISTERFRFLYSVKNQRIIKKNEDFNNNSSRHI